MMNPISPPGGAPSLSSVPRQHLPRAEDFLLWPPCLQSYGYRNVEQLFATRAITCGQVSRDLLRGQEVDVRYASAEGGASVADLMDRNNVAGLLVIRDGRVVLERYGLGLQPGERWSTMSMVKSMTATLAGAALQDGAIQSLDDTVARYLPLLQGSSYEQVTLRHLLTMSSGVQWSEVYTDRNSDVNRYSKSLADKVPGGVLRLLKTLPRAHAPGTVWSYNTGDTYLLGAAISAATGKTLADYMSEKVWKPCGMEFGAYYTLESEDGQEIGGSRAGMALRDIGRFAMFVMDGGVVDGIPVLPPDWVEKAASQAFAIPEASRAVHGTALGLTGYGYCWWLTEDGAMMAMGHSGQRLYIHRDERLIVVQLAVYPEPRYASPHEPDRDAELCSFIQALRAPSAPRPLAPVTTPHRA